jgi:hypothetical protein
MVKLILRFLVLVLILGSAFLLAREAWLSGRRGVEKSLRFHRLLEAQQLYMQNPESPCAGALFIDSALRYVLPYPVASSKGVAFDTMRDAWNRHQFTLLAAYENTVVYDSSATRVSLKGRNSIGTVRIDFIDDRYFDVQDIGVGMSGREAVASLFNRALSYLGQVQDD